MISTHPQSAYVATFADSRAVLFLSRGDDGDSHWITLDGTHVLIKGGRITKGPPALVGKSATVHKITGQKGGHAPAGGVVSGVNGQHYQGGQKLPATGERAKPVHRFFGGNPTVAEASMNDLKAIAQHHGLNPEDTRMNLVEKLQKVERDRRAAGTLGRGQSLLDEHYDRRRAEQSKTPAAKAGAEAANAMAGFTAPTTAVKPGLFGQSTIDAGTGKQREMFDTTKPAPVSEPIKGSKAALDPKNTAALPFDAATAGRVAAQKAAGTFNTVKAPKGGAIDPVTGKFVPGGRGTSR